MSYQTSSLLDPVVVNRLCQIDGPMLGGHGVLESGGTIKQHDLFVRLNAAGRQFLF